MIEPAAQRVELQVAGRRLDVLTLAGAADRKPIVMLHEGLGSIELWRDFPQQLRDATGRTVVVYSRYGHGRSERLAEAREVAYMHEEGTVVLPALLAQLGLRRPVLFGHSDGASIALIAAASDPETAGALVLEAPHVFVEPLTIESIARIGEPARRSDVIARLHRYHDDAAATFAGWNDIWLAPAFRAWDIRVFLDTVRCPVLVLQGEDDEYGTSAQVRAIAERVADTETVLFERAGHSPHRTQTATVLERTAAFLALTD